MIQPLRHLPLRRPLPLCFLVTLSVSVAIHAPLFFPASANAQATQTPTSTQAEQNGSGSATTVYTQSQPQTGKTPSSPDEKKLHALREAIKLYRKGDFNTALARFGTLSEQYPEETRATYYMALCNTQLGQYKEARYHYEEVLRKERGKNPHGKTDSPLMKLAKEGLGYLPTDSHGSAPVALDNPPRPQGNTIAIPSQIPQNQAANVQSKSQTTGDDKDRTEEGGQPEEASSNEWQGVSPSDMMYWQSMMGNNNNSSNNTDIWGSLGVPGMNFPNMPNANMMYPGMNYQNMMPGMGYPGMSAMPGMPGMPSYPNTPVPNMPGQTKSNPQGKNTTPAVDPQLWNAWMMNQMMQNSTQLMDSNRNDRD